MDQIRWQIEDQTIPYLLGDQCLEEIAGYIAELAADKAFLITDAWMAGGYAQALHRVLHKRLPSELLVMEQGEDHKNLACLEQLAAQALALDITRSSLIIAVGGGIVGNTAGLLAALLFRGIRLVHVPTTLLAMHDSVTSLKQAVNVNGAKNILGTYYRPTAILVDLHTLHSLPERHLRSGVYELIKNGLILGGAYKDRLKQLVAEWHAGDARALPELIKLGVDAKQSLLQADPKERYHGIIFEYGHTIGHAFELALHGQLCHGEAVAWGMRCAGAIARSLAYMSEAEWAEHEALLTSIGQLPQPGALPIDLFMHRIMLDNKRGYIDTRTDHVPMLLLKRAGEFVGDVREHFLTQVPASMVRTTLLNLELAHDESHVSLHQR